MLKAITRRAKTVDEKVAAHNASLKASKPDAQPVSVAYFFDHLAGEEDTQVVVEEDDFWAAKRELVPSVSAEELGHYDRVRRTFEGAERAKQEEQERARNSAATTHQQNANDSGRPKSSHRPVSNGSDGHRPGSKGKGKGKGKGKSNFGGDEEDGDESSFQTSDGHRDAADTTDDDYVIRTDHLKIGENGTVDKGKGKGKATAVEGFGDGAEGDEDLYA